MGSHSSTPEPYPVIRRFAQHAEEAGFDSLWAFEHVLFRMPGQAERGAHEAWTVMSLLGEATRRIEIGSLVLGMRFRNPALLAKMAATLDDAIGGRLTLGVSAGWHDPEYVAFGWPTDHRLGRTEEGFRILRIAARRRTRHVQGSLGGGRRRGPAATPARRIPILSSSRMGRMAGIVARYANLWNGAWVASPNDEVLTARMAELDRACESSGREPADIGRTAGVSVRYEDAELPGPTGNREKDIMGDPGAVAAALNAFAEAGFVHVMAWPEPLNERSIDRLAEALAILRA